MMRTTTTKWLGTAALAATTTVFALVGSPIEAAQATAGATAAYCGISWGSTAKQANATSAEQDELTNVRAGRHECFDRMVLDGASWARVSYVTEVYSDPQGNPVPLRGSARLQILTSRSDDVDTGRPTYTPADPDELLDVTGYRTFRQAAFAGDFEGQTTLGLGVRARLPFRVFALAATSGPPRIVIDVANRW